MIVPFRDQPDQNRGEQLRRFAAQLPTFLRAACVQPPLASLHVLVVEQGADGCKFNRGKALNAGLRLALGSPAEAAALGLPPSVARADALCLHDVDLLPTAPLARYYARRPGARPLHLGSAWKRYPYDTYVGGVITLSRAHAGAIDGFPNNFWGWGGEDDALAARMQAAGLYPPERPGREADHGYVDLEETLIAERGGLRAGAPVKQGGRAEWRNLLKREQMEDERRARGGGANGLRACSFTVTGTRRLNADVTVVTVDLLGRQDPLATPQAQAREYDRLVAAIHAGEAAVLRPELRAAQPPPGAESAGRGPGPGPS